MYTSKVSKNNNNNTPNDFINTKIHKAVIMASHGGTISRHYPQAAFDTLSFSLFQELQ